jgi:hypothetical protein
MKFKAEMFNKYIPGSFAVDPEDAAEIAQAEFEKWVNPMATDEKPREPRIKVSTDEIVRDHNSLPVDISKVEWVMAKEFDQLRLERDALKKELEKLKQNANQCCVCRQIGS